MKEKIIQDQKSNPVFLIECEFINKCIDPRLKIQNRQKIKKEAINIISKMNTKSFKYFKKGTTKKSSLFEVLYCEY